MVSEVRFYPTGYLGTEQAAVLLAKLLRPENWSKETFLPGEEELWDGLGQSLSAEFIEYPLVKLRDEAKLAGLDFSPLRTRWVNFDQAMQRLQKSLFAGEISAGIVDSAGNKIAISKELWGGVHGVDSLLRGLVQTTYPRAVILVEVAAIKALATNIARISAPQQISKISAEEKCLSWLQQQLNIGANLSKGDYEAAALKKFEISKKGFRERIWPRAVQDPSQSWRQKAGAKPKRGSSESTP